MAGVVTDRLTATFDAHRALVARVMRSFGVPEADVDDATQEAFCVLANRLEDVAPGNERAFLVGIARRLAHASRRAIQARREVFDEHALTTLRADVPPSDDLVDEHRARVELERAIADLPDSLREVLVLHDLDRMTMAEIAEARSIPPGTVASRLRRARGSLAHLRVVVAGAIAALFAFFSRRSAAAPLWLPATCVLALIIAARPPAPVLSAAPTADATAAAATASAPLASPVRVVPSASATAPPFRARVAAAPAPTLAPAAAPVRDDELTLVARAKTALVSGDVAAAERALEQRDRRYPSGTFAIESAVLRIELALARGDTTAARDAASRFLARYPDSAYERRVRRLAAREP